ncbi:MAG: GatB/YqeY domain-containing protein [Candidatus Gracilibacteria bacterium]|nr:GatB/YqeY domain-containing protein [bacterium]MDZ4216932.1 GatB/YqeY domain-containing protein [Candidatus Gracilibacteria bacterium]
MLKDQLYADIITAMKARETVKTEALKMMKAEIMKLEVSGANIVADDEAVTQILKRGIKQRHESAEGFKQGGNLAAAEKELQEAKILKAYLPEQMSEEEITKVVQETVRELGASGPSDMGKVMAAIMPKLGGKADGGLVNRIVKETLTS